MRRITGLLIGGIALTCAAVGLRLTLDRSQTSSPNPPIPANIDEIDRGTAQRVKSVAVKIRAEPGNSQHWHELGLTYQANGMLDLALASYSQAVAVDSKRVKSWYMMAIVQYRQGDVESALGSMHRVIELQRDYAPAWWRVGFWNMELGRLEDAQFAFDVTRKLDPHNLAAAVGLARLRLQQDDPEATARLLAPYVDAMPREHAAFGYMNHLLNTAYRRMGEVGSATHALALSKSNITEPRWDDPWDAEQANYVADINARIMHAEWLASQSRLDEAISLARELLKEDSNSISLRLLIARCYREQRQFNRSREAIAEAAEFSPDWTNVHVQAALTALAESGHVHQIHAGQLRDEALNHITRALEINPVLPVSHGVRGSILAVMGRFQEAAQSFRKAAAHDRDPTHWLVRAAEAHANNEQWQQAAALLERVTGETPTHADAWLQLGLARSRLGEIDAAQQALLKAQQLRPDDARISTAIQELRTSGQIQSSTVEVRR